MSATTIRPAPVLSSQTANPTNPNKKNGRTRSNSGEIPRHFLGQPEYFVEQSAHGPPMHVVPMGQGAPSHSHRNHHHHHHRTLSWSGSAPNARPPVAAPPRGPFLVGNGEIIVDGSHPENQLLLLHRQYASERHLLTNNNNHPRRSSKRQHRKSLSSSSAMAGDYGAFWTDPAAPIAAASINNSTRTSTQPRFSPRNDFMTLTGSLRGERYRSVTSSSPTVETRKSWRLAPQELNGGNGEAVFLATRKVQPESERKRLIREQTAQSWVEDVKGVTQPLACRDVFFLLLFVFHLIAIFYIGSVYGKEALRSSRHSAVIPTDLFDSSTAIEQKEPIDSSLANGDPVTIYYQNLVFIAMLCGPFTMALSALMLGVMTMFAKYFVQIALVTVLGLSFLWGTVGIYVSPKTAVPVTGVIVLALTVAYTFIVWDRIPFASANLITALRGVHAYPGTIVVAFCVQALALVYSVYYSIVVVGVYNALKEGKIAIPANFHFLIFMLLATSYYWTFQVLLNSVQTATAAVIGGWWYDPKNPYHVRQSCFKTFFYYMGPICFGSLFVGPVRLLRQLSGFIRPSAAEESLLCLHECLHCIQIMMSSCIENISANFSPWGFTYVGLYGYGFLDASYNASVLFHKRGWTVVVSDDLVPNILLIASVVLGGVTGCFAHMISQLDGLHLTSLEDPGLVSFVEGCIIGLVLTSVLFGVISSSVNTVIVCFAASPVDFEHNHPDLSREMRSAWREVWPDALDAIDLRLAMMSGHADRHAPVFNGVGPFV